MIRHNLTDHLGWVKLKGIHFFVFFEVVFCIISSHSLALNNEVYSKKSDSKLSIVNKSPLFKTSLGLFIAVGQFDATTEETDSNLEGYGLLAELRPTSMLWAFRGDFFTTKKESQVGSLAVSTTYREFRVWVLRYFRIDSTLSFYGGGGIGALSALANMSVMDDSKELEGRPEFLAAYLLGLRMSFKPGLFLSFFRQSSYAPSYPNQNISSYAFSLGYTF